MTGGDVMAQFDQGCRNILSGIDGAADQLGEMLRLLEAHPALAQRLPADIRAPLRDVLDLGDGIHRRARELAVGINSRLQQFELRLTKLRRVLDRVEGD